MRYSDIVTIGVHSLGVTKEFPHVDYTTLKPIETGYSHDVSEVCQAGQE
jgi:hypothetical protein